MLKEQIKKYRHKKNWSQEELSRESSVSYSIVTKLKQGVINEPTIQTVMKLAKALNVNIDELVKNNNFTKTLNSFACPSSSQEEVRRS